MTTIAVIPARFGAQRFPGKPLIRDSGKFLVQHVYEQVSKSRRIDRAIVATDDERILKAVSSFGGEGRMTRPDHASGTDRVAEVAEEMGLGPTDLVLNVQGDEPEIEPSSLDQLVERMRGEDRPSIGTLAAPFAEDGPGDGPGSPMDPNCVKVVLGTSGQALYFSRSPIPFPRSTGGRVDRPSLWLLHMGVYAFRVEALLRVAGGRLAPTDLERTESLEQLRWLENGWPVSVVIVERASVGIDTPADYEAFLKRIKTATLCG